MDGKTKNLIMKGNYMEFRGSGVSRPANEFKMADRRIKLQATQLPIYAAQHCSALVYYFYLVLSLLWISRELKQSLLLHLVERLASNFAKSI